MQTSRKKTEIELPSGIRLKLEDFRKQVRRVKLAEGIAGAIVGLGLSYLLLFGLDRIFETPVLVRCSLLSAGMVGLGLFLPLKLHRWFWQLRKLEQVARLLRRSLPRLGDHLLGVIELARSDGDNHRSQTLVQAAMQQVDEASRSQTFNTAVPNPRHVHWIAAAVTVCLLGAIGILTIPNAAWNTAKRWIMPWGNIERYTFAQLDLNANEKVVAFAEPFHVPVNLKDSSSWQPKTATAQYKQQNPVTAQLLAGGYVFKIPPQRAAGALTLRAGDDKEKIHIRPLPRPELLSLDASVQLPQYLKYEEPLIRDGRSGKIAVLAGSRVRLVATISREIGEGRYGEKVAEIDASSLKTEWFSVDADQNIKLGWTDIHGLQSKEPFHLQLDPVDDNAPSVQARTSLDDRILLEDEVATFDIFAKDDYGIRQVGLEWGNEVEQDTTPSSKGWKPVTAGNPQEREINAKAAFRPKSEGLIPQTIQIRAFAEDYLPGRSRSYSEPFTLHILSNEEHALWVSEQLHEWRRRAIETYETELELNQRNKDIRKLASEELDKPSTRKLIEQQANAEEANGRQLSDLAQSGEGLLKQAARNPDFEGNQLEPLAQTLQSLKDIADKRMPTVADLLSKAANAPSEQTEVGPQAGQNKSSSNADGSQQASSPDSNKPVSPSVTDTESSLANNSQNSSGNQPSSSSKPVLGLPSTTVPGTQEGEQPETSEPQSAGTQLDNAIDEQDRLLEEFAKVADELNQILMNLEGSTFVKRLKAASRKQMSVAGELDAGLLDSFGSNAPDLSEKRTYVAASIAETETSESKKIQIIHEDLEAFYERVREDSFLKIIDQMSEFGVVRAVHKIGESVKDSNHSGQSIAAAEFWADKLDLWADDLAEFCEACQSAQGQAANKADLPPDVILEVLRVLQEEVELRESTRSLEQAKNALGDEKYASRAVPLQEKQSELEERIVDTVSVIRELPDSARHFRKEMALLLKVAQVMEEAADILSQPDTGRRAIAAETEAIELLLEAKKSSGQSTGGSGSGNSPNGGGQGTTSRSALALLGESNDAEANVIKRKVGQSTGTSGALLPAEFRDGLDAYFNALEKPKNLQK